MIAMAQPQVLIMVHTQHPEVFQTLHDNVILPEKGSQLTSKCGEHRESHHAELRFSRKPSS
jgi:mRNA degradation ribonuclease J1/J2